MYGYNDDELGIDPRWAEEDTSFDERDDEDYDPNAKSAPPIVEYDDSLPF